MSFPRGIGWVKLLPGMFLPVGQINQLGNNYSKPALFKSDLNLESVRRG